MTVVDTSLNLYIFSHPPKFKHKITHWNSKKKIFECYLVCFVRYIIEWNENKGDIMIWGRLFKCPIHISCTKKENVLQPIKTFLSWREAVKRYITDLKMFWCLNILSPRPSLLCAFCKCVNSICWLCRELEVREFYNFLSKIKSPLSLSSNVKEWQK